MAIPEAQLETWSAQGSIQQSAATYQTIKGVLDSSSAPYHGRSTSSFLQGSYGNGTNIYADSDVDIVIVTSTIFYFDVDRLPAPQQANFHNAFPNSGNYSYASFKEEVTAWLIANYGAAVHPGSKAIFIKGNSSRRDSDVLPAAEHRSYYSFPSSGAPGYHSGIVFWKSDGTKIVNYPKQHADNCAAKHEATRQWYKRTVRVFKNMRNRMVQDGYIEEGIAPSYYLEGLLYNAPNGRFGGSFENTFLQCMDYFRTADRTQFTCANEIHWLLRSGQEVCWEPANCGVFLSAAANFWHNW